MKTPSTELISQTVRSTVKCGVNIGGFTENSSRVIIDNQECANYCSGPKIFLQRCEVFTLKFMFLATSEGDLVLKSRKVRQN